MSEIADAIQLSKRLMDTDPNLAVYILRDFPELVEWKLDDLAWSMYRETCSRSDVEFLIEQIEKNLSNEGEN